MDVEDYRRTSREVWEAMARALPEQLHARGRPLYEERLYDVYTFSKGRLVRKREFRTRAEALDAAGRP